jgi:hypothetical protein
MPYVNLVGRENMTAGTDGGMSREHRQICGAKLQVLLDGVAPGSTQLGG